MKQRELDRVCKSLESRDPCDEELKLHRLVRIIVQGGLKL